MELSIIIVSYNTRELLKQCLESIFERCKDAKMQRCKDMEIIVVDNGSRDGSREYLKTQNSKLKTKTQNLKVIFNNRNLGFAKAVNQGINQAEGEAILLLNSDTQVKKGALEELLEFERKVGPAIIGARLLNTDGSIQASVFHLPTIKRAILEYWLGRKGEFSKHAPSGRGPDEVEAVVGGAMLISREVIEKIGLFDERYFMYFEDLDYCRRAKKAGFKIYYFPEAEIIHEHGASGIGLIDEENQWRRLVPSSKIYHGLFKHYLISFILWLGQKIK